MKRGGEITFAQGGRKAYLFHHHAMNPDIDLYLAEGCGRCPLGGTPACKVHPWQAGLVQLRRIALACGLTEVRKWGVPCYTYAGQNVALIGAFKDYFALSFPQGALLQDPEGLLVKPGPHSQAGRLFRFTETGQPGQMEAVLKAYLFEAMEAAKAGLKVVNAPRPEPIPEELAAFFDEDPAFQAAFEALTPGRQRGYILHFSQPKQAQTRIARIEKQMARIFDGQGMHDR